MTRSVCSREIDYRFRQTNESAVCQPEECDSSLIPLNNTIVVPGGRYREIYYWDSYWVLQGLLKSELYDYATALIMNFMDFIRVSHIHISS
jgi:alpha,alpha-trehalase